MVFELTELVKNRILFNQGDEYLAEDIRKINEVGQIVASLAANLKLCENKL